MFDSTINWVQLITSKGDLMKKVSRRGILSIGLGATALIASKAVKAQALCSPTPRDGQGPFHPTQSQLINTIDQDSDLTFIKGKTGSAKGQLIYVMGEVRDQDCQPIVGAKVRIWQANKWGKYVHPGDTSGKPDDPEFQGWGEAITDQEGRYVFKSILPGEYGPGGASNRRRHIHFKVFRPNNSEALTTQMYFSQNHPLTQNDLSGERPNLNLIREFNTPSSDSEFESNSFLIFFPVSIRR